MVEVEWLSDNGSPCTAHEIRRLAQEIGTTPIESPQSNGMAEVFVKTLKRDYARVVPRPDASLPARRLVSNTTTPCTRTRRWSTARRASSSANTVGAVRRPNECTMSADAIGSRAKPPQAVAPSASLDRPERSGGPTVRTTPCPVIQGNYAKGLLGWVSNNRSQQCRWRRHPSSALSPPLYDGGHYRKRASGVLKTTIDIWSHALHF